MYRRRLGTISHPVVTRMLECGHETIEPSGGIASKARRAECLECTAAVIKQHIAAARRALDAARRKGQGPTP